MDYIAVTKFLQDYPEYKRMHSSVQWITEYVGNSYQYDESVCENKLYTYYGRFMELFIRKCLCKRFGMACKDAGTQKLLDRNSFPVPSLKQTFRNAYAAYTDDRRKAMDIIEEIKIVALTQRLHFYEREDIMIDVYNMHVNLNNLREVVQFLYELPYKSMKFKQPCEYEYDLFVLSGVPDCIFDNRVFCQIATSKYHQVYKRKYAQVLFYILSHYEENYYGDELDKKYTAMIYNPLLGINYTADLLMTPSKYEDLRYKIDMDMDEVIQRWYSEFYRKEQLKDKHGIFAGFI